MTGRARRPRSAITASSVPGAVANILTGGAATRPRGHLCGDGGLRADRHGQLQHPAGLAAGNFVINKATPTATLAVNNSPQTYDGAGKAATVGIYGQFGAGRGGEHSDRRRGHQDQRGDLCGDGGLRADRHDQLQHPDWRMAAGNFVINKANATFTVMPYTCPTTTYTGFSHTATVSMSMGVNGETGATIGTINLIDTIHTTDGIYNSDPWTFTGTANYNDTSGTVDDCIAEADATVVVTPYTCPGTTYTGLPHTATYTITGVNGETGARWAPLT